MPKSESASCLHKRFSHIYVEDRARSAPLTERILSKLPDAARVGIRNYKELFNRKRQSFTSQKQSPKLILAVKQPPFLYPLPLKCQNFFERHAFYTTPVTNCVFDCSFCFLKGMYDSANLVVFVNVDDFFDAARNAASMLKATEALSLHISYESDLLALEPLTGLCREWLDFTRGVPNLNVELRTRCGTFLKNAPPLDRFIAAWSLSPAEVVKKYEFGAPKLNARLRAAASAAASGFPIRLCFDPVLPVENGFEHYTQLFESVFDALPKASIKDVGIGPFRAEKAHLQKMRQGHLENDLVWDDASLRSESLAVALSKSLECFIEKEKIALWQSQS